MNIQNRRFLSWMMIGAFVLSIINPLAFMVVSAETGLGDPMPISDVPEGSIIVDIDWTWEHRTGDDYTIDVVPNARTVSWRLVAHNHYDGNGGAGTVAGGVEHVTLLSNEIIGKYAFDNSTDRNGINDPDTGWNSGSNHWGDSGTTDATRGIRPFLNNDFFSMMSVDFQNAVLETNLPNMNQASETLYNTNDMVFLPSQTELGGGITDTYEIGAEWLNFAAPADRIAEIDWVAYPYWTRSPASGFSHSVRYVHDDGDFFQFSANDPSKGIRPALNLSADVWVAEDPVGSGYYEIMYNYKATIGDLDVGDRVVDPSWEWEHRTGQEYSDTGAEKPVTWIVVAKDHYGEGQVTLLSEELIGRLFFDQSNDRGSAFDGSNHWGESGLDAELGIRKFLNGSVYEGPDASPTTISFYDEFSESFKSSIIPTSVPCKENSVFYGGEDYFTNDHVFLPSEVELTGTSSGGAFHASETRWEFFDINNAQADRIAQFGGDDKTYWTRSPEHDDAAWVRIVAATGVLMRGNATSNNDYLRPAVNIDSSTAIVPHETLSNTYVISYPESVDNLFINTLGSDLSTNAETSYELSFMTSSQGGLIQGDEISVEFPSDFNFEGFNPDHVILHNSEGFWSPNQDFSVQVLANMDNKEINFEILPTSSKSLPASTVTTIQIPYVINPEVKGDYQIGVKTSKDIALAKQSIYIFNPDNIEGIWELPIGWQVKDEDNSWEFKDGDNYSEGGTPNYAPIDWLIVDKDETGVTLQALDVICRYAFDDAGANGRNRWDASGTDPATHGLRAFLNSFDKEGDPAYSYQGDGFFKSLSFGLQSVILETEVVNKDWQSGAVYSTFDKVYIPSITELGVADHSNTYEIGNTWQYYKIINNMAGIYYYSSMGMTANEARIANFNSEPEGYWTRSPVNNNDYQLTHINTTGDIGYTSASVGSRGVRPVIRVSGDAPVSYISNKLSSFQIPYLSGMNIYPENYQYDEMWEEDSEISITIMTTNIEDNTSFSVEFLDESKTPFDPQIMQNDVFITNTGDVNLLIPWATPPGNYWFEVNIPDYGIQFYSPFEILSEILIDIDSVTLTPDNHNTGEPENVMVGIIASGVDDYMPITITLLDDAYNPLEPLVFNDSAYTENGEASGNLYIPAEVEAGNYFIKVEVHGANPYFASYTINPPSASVNPENHNYTLGSGMGLSVTINPNGNTFEDIYEGANVLVSGEDYLINGEEITILPSYLDTKTTGNLILTFKMDAGTDPELTINIFSGNAEVDPVFENYISGSATDLTINLKPNGRNLLSINDGTDDLTAVTDYSVDGNTYTILPAFLDAKPFGEHTLFFIMDGGTNPTVAINIDGYTVTFLDYDDTVLDTQTVAHGGAATEPPDPWREGYTFTSWDVDFSNVTEPLTVTATYTINQYNLTYNAGVGGTISGDTPQTVNHGFAGTEVTAVPASGYHFVDWSDGVLTASRTDTNVTDDIIVTAIFAETTVSFTPNGNLVWGNYHATEVTVNSGSAVTENEYTWTTSPDFPTGETWMPFTSGVSIETPGEASGEFYLHVRATHPDYPGNVVEVSSNAFNIDNTLPNIIFDPNGNATAQTEHNVTITVFDNFSGINTAELKYQWTDSGIFPTGGDWVVLVGDTLTTPSGVDGNVYLHVTATDNAGNTTEETSLPFNVLLESILTLTSTEGGSVILPGEGQFNRSNGNTENIEALAETGYQFVNWTATAGTLGDPNNENTTFTMPASDATLTANFAINEYTITFDSDGGSAVAPITQDFGTAVVAPADPTREGYTFDGWDPVVPGTMPADNITLTAQWLINEYTITFEDWDGTILKTEVVEHGSSATAPADPVRTGSTFTGWDTDFSNVTNHITVTAQYQIITYTLTYAAGVNGAIEGDESQEVDYGSDGTEVTAVPDEGYHFVQWSDGVTTAPRTDTNISDNISVTASFAINEYTVTFRDYDGTILKTEVVEHGSSATAPADPVRTGYTFTGWDTDFSNVTNHITVTAEYNINQYTITFDSDGGSAVAPITQDFGSAVTAPIDPVLEGYTFTGWDPEVPTTMPGGDITLTAQWLINEYTISYTAGEGGSIDGEINQTVEHGQDGIAVTAVPEPDYFFVGWDDGVSDATRIDSNVTESIEVTALFELMEQWDAYVSPDYVNYIIGIDPEPVIFLDSGSWTFLDIYVGSIDLVAGIDYAVSGDYYTINSSYLENHGPGYLELTFKMSGGINPVVNIYIEEEYVEDLPVEYPVAGFYVISEAGNLYVDLYSYIENFEGVRYVVSESAPADVMLVHQDGRATTLESNLFITLTEADFAVFLDKEYIKIKTGERFILSLGNSAAPLADSAGVETVYALCGDASGDGMLTVKDAILVLRHIVGLAELEEDAIKRAGLDEILTVKDAITILRRVVGLEESTMRLI